MNENSDTSGTNPSVLEMLGVNQSLQEFIAAED